MSSLDRLYETIESRRDDLVELTQSLVAIPTVNPPGACYQTFCDLVARRLAGSGFSIQILRAKGTPTDSEARPRLNLLARLAGSRPGPCVHFNSHYDVVRPGNDWTRDPFGGCVEGDRLYGRGACDMKGGLATSIVAAEAFAACFPDFAGTLEISATADEETGGYAGVAWLASEGHFDPDRVQHVIIPEPLHKDRICLGHRGVYWAEIETVGRIAHGCMPFLGECAIGHMGAVLAALETDLRPRLVARQTEAPIIPPAARQSTLNINAIHGGEEERGGDGFPSACVTDSCRLVLDRRFLPEESVESVRGELVGLLDGIKVTRPGFAYQFRELFSVPPVMTDRQAPIVRHVSTAIEAVLGQTPELILSPGTYDQKHIAMIGGLDNCIAYGPGRLDLAHRADEWISITDMIDSAKVMAHTMTLINT